MKIRMTIDFVLSPETVERAKERDWTEANVVEDTQQGIDMGELTAQQAICWACCENIIAVKVAALEKETEDAAKPEETPVEQQEVESQA